MSFFVLVNRSHLPDGWASFHTKAERSGFRQQRAFDTPHLQGRLFGNLSGDAPAFHQAPNGDFIAVLGSLIHHGQAAPACLPEMLAGFRADEFAWRDLLGTYVVLVGQGGRLHVFADGLGACKLYTNADGTLWSNSFLAMLELCAPRRLDVQACYEYVCNGAVFGDRTLVAEIRALPPNCVLQVDAEVSHRVLPSPISSAPPPADATLERVAQAQVRQLDTVFEPITQAYRDRLRISFSGGFDSRLMLAMLLRHGVRPTLFVYGGVDDEDVRIARTITRAEGLELVHIDKDAAPDPDPDDFAGTVEHDLFAFDGWKVEYGLFDFGIDRRDRLARHGDGQVPLNGSLGEIYRNFFYMPDRRSSTLGVVSTFYSPYDPAAFTRRFDERRYRAALAAAMRDAIGAPVDSLARHQVEDLYPKFRGRFWTGRDAQLNQRFGDMFLPYLEPAAISNTAGIPLGMKDLGRLQGRMIASVHPRLAAYPSDYGFALDGPRPLPYRVKTFLGTQRPAWLRKLSFRLKHRTRQPVPAALEPALLSRVLDVEFPLMRTLFRLERINSAQQFGLIATLEYLGQRYGLAVPDAE